MKHRVIFFILQIFISFGFSVSAYACSCENQSTPADALQNSDAVFSGKVISIAELNKGDFRSSSDPLIIKFEADTVWKGPDTQTITVFTAASSASCGFEFQEGKSYLVYANGDYSSLDVSLCSRTTLFANAYEDLKSIGNGIKPQDTPPEPPAPVSEINYNLDQRIFVFAIILVTVTGVTIYSLKRK